MEQDINGVTLKLPYQVYNVSQGMNKSTKCVLSANNEYAVSGIRKELYIWDAKNGDLVKTLAAHVGRIIDVQPLAMGALNIIITSSIDRTVKVWNINHILKR